MWLEALSAEVGLVGLGVCSSMIFVGENTNVEVGRSFLSGAQNPEAVKDG